MHAFGIIMLALLSPWSTVAPAVSAPAGAPSEVHKPTVTVTFTATARRAEVYLEGHLIGTTTLQYDLEPGEHRVTIKADGYKPYEKVLTLRGAETINAELEEIPVPTKEYKTEWVGLRGVGGNYGGGASVSIATLRWRRLYWDIGRLSGGGGLKYWALGGTTVGMPFQLTKSGVHEIRVALGLMAGYTRKEKVYTAFVGSSQHYQTGFLYLCPEVYYLAHVHPRIALQVGVELDLTIVWTNSPKYIEQWGHAYMPPMVLGFLGLRYNAK